MAGSGDRSTLDSPPGRTGAPIIEHHSAVAEPRRVRARVVELWPWRPRQLERDQGTVLVEGNDGLSSVPGTERDRND